MLVDAVAILAVAVLCAGWVLFQRWIARLDPELPGIKRSCSGCAVPGAAACGKGCSPARGTFPLIRSEDP